MGFFAKLFGSKKQPEPVINEAYLELVATHDYSKPPEFPYYPNAYKDGTIVQEQGKCDCCGKEVDYILHEPLFYSLHDVDDLCPWCVASGAAAIKYNGQFCEIDSDCIDSVPAELQDNVNKRTPSFSGWQQERWLGHCGDMMEYIATAENSKGLKPYLTPEFKESLQNDAGFDNADFDSFLKEFENGGGSLLVYIFRCRHCGIYQAYQDCD